jgi:hypothetical protein
MDQKIAVYTDHKVAWQHIAKDYENDLNHYFRFMYHMVNYVDTSKMQDKYFYVRILRSNLSESELILLALNCAYGEGREKFKKLVEKYALLHNLSRDACVRLKLFPLFEHTAFNRNDAPS